MFFEVFISFATVDRGLHPERRHVKSFCQQVRPLFMNFFNDSQAWDISDQFMWGEEMMVTPVTDAGKTEVDPFFPVGTW